MQTTRQKSSYMRDVRQRFFHHKMAVFALGFLILEILCICFLLERIVGVDDIVVLLVAALDVAQYL